uniref:ARAD1C41162p n=1 Tax=Blastobotrys adeninivorans TaxID=409370 RepID=A0A060T443_BLAAD
MPKRGQKQRQTSLLQFSSTQRQAPKRAAPIREVPADIADLINEISDSSDDDACGDGQNRAKRQRKLSPVKPTKPQIGTPKTIADVSEVSTPRSPSITDQWITRFQPTRVDEVAIHKKRVAEVRDALSLMIESSFDLRLLILSGPAGCSKSTIVKVVASEMNVDLIEWDNPEVFEGSILEAFSDFLDGMKFRASNGDRRELILVEDLPNIFHSDTRQAFCQTILQWLHQQRNGLAKFPPLVISVTEVESDSSWMESIMVETLFPRSILFHPAVRKIKFQPVNATLIKKTLRSIVRKANISGISSKEIEQAISSLAELGDIRSAIGGLEFWARWRRYGVSLPVGRDDHLDLFHAIGRVVHGAHKDKNGIPVTTNDEAIETVTQDWCQAYSVLPLALLENYPAAHGGRIAIDSAADCADALSIADTYPFSSSTEISGCALSVRAVRTIMGGAKLRNVKSSFTPLVYPRDRKMTRLRVSAAKEVGVYSSNRSVQSGVRINFDDAVLLDGYYEMIASRRNNRLQNRRIGGRIGSEYIHADSARGIESDDDQEVLVEAPVQEVKGALFSDDDISDSDD